MPHTQSIEAMLSCIFFLASISTVGFSANVQQSNPSDDVLAPESLPVDLSDVFSFNDSSSIELDGLSSNQTSLLGLSGLDFEDAYQYPDLIETANDGPTCGGNSYGRDLNHQSCLAAMTKTPYGNQGASVGPTS